MYNRKTIFYSACIGMLFFGISFIALGSIVPGLKAKFAMDEIAAGTMFSILPFGILTGSLLFGPLCDRYGYKILLSTSCLLIFLGFEGIAYVPSTFLLKISILMFAAGGGAINGATNALVADISEKDKGAALSLLGVFFGIGALGMPFVIGVLDKRLNYDSIISIVGFASLALSIVYLLLKFPEAKQKKNIDLKQINSIMKDPLIWLIAFFLFCQSSFEAIINNWTTTFLSGEKNIPANKALFALSLFVLGLTGMRLLLGSVFKTFSHRWIWILSFSLTACGIIFLVSANSFNFSAMGLILIGAGLAAGFPIMLGYVGNRYEELSGTAFSMVLVVALIGNTLVNYLMGVIANAYGIHHLVTVIILELVTMCIICALILNKLKHS